jgi:hypothetical protein
LKAIKQSKTAADKVSGCFNFPYSRKEVRKSRQAETRAEGPEQVKIDAPNQPFRVKGDKKWLSNTIRPLLKP